VAAQHAVNCGKWVAGLPSFGATCLDSLKGLVMMVRKFAAAAVLALGAVAAQATETLWTLSLDVAKPVSLLATTAPGNPITSFEVVGKTPDDFLFELSSPTLYGLDFNALAAGSYTVRLVTAGTNAISVGAATTGSAPLLLTAVPEPEAYGLALAGLSVVGALAARRRRAANQA
jgi:PEP-CTERM motif